MLGGIENLQTLPPLVEVLVLTEQNSSDGPSPPLVQGA